METPASVAAGAGAKMTGAMGTAGMVTAGVPTAEVVFPVCTPEIGTLAGSSVCVACDAGVAAVALVVGVTCVLFAVSTP